jgi:hypothetical protein
MHARLAWHRRRAAGSYGERMPVAYTSPLRAAIVRLARYGLPFSLSALTGIGVCSDAGARRYAGELVKRRVLVKVGTDYNVGPGFAEWTRETPRTRPGGNRQRYVRKAISGAPHPR